MGKRLSLFVGDAQVDSGQGIADRPGHPFAVQGVGGDDPRLGHAIALQHDLAGTGLKLAMGFGQHRG